jgi:O-antigen/teichoic acid export membrane protein
MKIFPSSSKVLAAPSLAVSFVWTLAGSAFYAGCQWAVIILLAKLGTAAMVGQYAFAAAIAYPVSLVANLQLRAIFVNDREGRYPFRGMLGTRYVLVAFACLILLFICAFTRSAVNSTALLLVVAASMLVDSISESYFSLLQKCERMDRIARSQIFRGSLGLGAAATTLYYTHSLLWAIGGMLLAKSFVLATYDSGPGTFIIANLNGEAVGELPRFTAVLTRFRPTWDFKRQWEMLWSAFPLGIVSVLVSLNVNIPRYIVEHDLGSHELGIYSALSYIPYAALLFASALGYVAFARLGKLYFERDIRGFKVLLGKMLLIAGGLGAVALLGSAIAGKSIVQIVYRPEYAEHLGLLMWLVATAAMSGLATCVGVAMTATSQFRVQIPLFLTVASVSATTAYVLVPKLGLYGAAIATLASLVVQVIGSYWIVRRALKWRMLTVRERNGEAPVAEPVLASES